MKWETARKWMIIHDVNYVRIQAKKGKVKLSGRDLGQILEELVKKRLITRREQRSILEDIHMFRYGSQKKLKSLYIKKNNI